jgi:Ca2+/Na+ antiporter
MMSFGVLMATNALMFALSWLSSLIVGKQMHERPQAFVRGVYSATFLKLIICMGSFLGFVLLHRAHIYKPLVFAMFGIYIFYTVAETIILSKMARAKQ